MLFAKSIEEVGSFEYLQWAPYLRMNVWKSFDYFSEQSPHTILVFVQAFVYHIP